MSFLAYVFYETFYQYQTDVDQILAEIPAEEKELPSNVLKVFKNTKEINNINHFVTTNLRISATEKHKRISNGEWHLFGIVWLKLLPLRIGEKETSGYYLKNVYFGNHKTSNGDVSGFRSAAKFYFHKELQDLSEEETLVLMIFAQSSEYVRNVNSDFFQKKLNEFTQIYYANSAN